MNKIFMLFMVAALLAAPTESEAGTGSFDDAVVAVGNAALSKDAATAAAIIEGYAVTLKLTGADKVATARALADEVLRRASTNLAFGAKASVALEQAVVIVSAGSAILVPVVVLPPTTSSGMHAPPPDET